MRPIKEAQPIIMIITTRPAAHRVDHTSISAAPDDLRSRSRTAAVHSVNVCMHRSACWSVDVSLFALFESVCACMCVDCIDVCFESDRRLAKKDFTRWKPVQLASETYDNTPHTRLARALRSSSKITSASFARRFVLDGHGEEGICSNNGKLWAFIS